MENVYDDYNESNSDDGKENENIPQSFHILNCESLKSIEIDRYSFHDNAGQSELKNLSALQPIQIVTIGSYSCNFFYSSFVIENILNDIENVIIRSS